MLQQCTRIDLKHNKQMQGDVELENSLEKNRRSSRETEMENMR